MPCNCDGYDNTPRELDDAVRAACEMANELKGTARFNRLSKRTQLWVARHDEIDAQRKKQEEEIAEHKRLRQSALAKLTPAEREALRR